MANASSPTQGLNPTATPHGVTNYLPLEGSTRKGTALCLSGGGYRASLFDVGSMRRLNELGILSQVDTFSSVSGGSIAAAFVAAHLFDRLNNQWSAPGEVVPGFDEGIASPMRTLATKNIRTSAALARLNPLNVRNANAASNTLAASYADSITKIPISSLPDRPRFVFCTTDLQLRTQWVIDSGLQRQGSDEIGYQSPLPGDWTVARAVAASSCFPGVFPPVQLDNNPGEFTGGSYTGIDRDALCRETQLTDGGVYDNLGLEPVWKDHAVVLVADASPSFSPKPGLGPAWPSLRPIVTLLEQATNVRKRWLLSSFLNGSIDGVYWGISSLPSNYGPGPDVTVYPDDLINRVISQVRIELDSFSEAEIGVLENHGYLMTDLAIKTHNPQLIRQFDVPLALPFPEWMDTRAIERELKNSHKYKLLGRGRLT